MGMLVNPSRFGSAADPVALSIYSKIVAWWEHATNSTDAVLDSHTGGYHLTASGSFSYGQTALAAGLPTCTKFTANTSAMSVAHASPLDLPATYSIMQWFKRDGAQASFPTILTKPTDVFNGRATYELFLNSLKPVFRFNASGGSYFDATGTTTIADLTTYQIIATKLATGSELYLNNALDATQASGGTPDVATLAVYHGQSGTANGLIGYYGASALFNAPLTSTERAYLYASGAGISYAALATAAGH